MNNDRRGEFPSLHFNLFDTSEDERQSNLRKNNQVMVTIVCE